MPVLGLRGTGSFTADVDRPRNWREGILYLFPNGEAPLTALLSKLKSESTDDPHFFWFEKPLQDQRLQINGAQTNVDTTIEIKPTGVSNEKNFKAGHLVLNERTEEIFIVASDPAVADTLTVVRGVGEVAGAAMNDGDNIVIVGSAYEEGASVPTAVSYDPSNAFNYCQIFRNSVQITRTAKKTRLRTEAQYEEAKRETLQYHSVEMERAFIYGQRNQLTVNGQLRRTTRGITKWITTNTADMGGTVTESDFDDKMEEAFRYGSNEKLALIGSTALNVLNKMAKNRGQIMLDVDREEAYGMQLTKYVSPFGVLYLKMHPLFNIHPEWRKNMLILDTGKLVYRYIDDTDFLTDRQAPGDDAKKDEFLTECGLEVHHEKAHAYYKNITTFAP